MNKIELVTPVLAGVGNQIAFLHSMSINYTRALDGAHPVTITNAGVSPALYELSNVPSANVWVVDTRFPDRATLVPYESQADGASFRIRFNGAGGGTGQFLVVPEGQENLPVAVSRRQVKPLKAAPYLAVGPSQFSAGVQPLLARRTKDGLRGQFADQEQVFDYYNYGRYGPVAIQNAVRSLRPQYLMLVGRTTYDNRNYGGANVDPLCPAFLVSTTFWAQATSDSMFGDLGRGYPEVAVGRLPVNTPAELSAAVQRILSYTGMPASGIRGHAVSDRADAQAGDFAAQAGSIVRAHPDVAWQANYLGVTYDTSPEVNAAMTAAASGGADLIVYVGHGNAVTLGAFAPRILDTGSVQNWTGNVVLLQSTCTANWMAKNVNDYRSIAIQALVQPQGGVSASIGTSTYMNSSDAVEFMNRLIGNANVHGMRWGDALLKTQQWANQNAGVSAFYKDLSLTEQIFGDPAMPVFSRTPAGETKPVGTTPPPPVTPAPATGTF